MVAGGSGTRFGAEKQFLALRGKPVVAWSVETARPVADGVVVVVPDGHGGAGPAGSTSADDRYGADLVVPGGRTRSASVRAGLRAVPEDAAVIVVHDAARPLAPASLFAAVVDAVRAGDAGAVPVLAVSDTLKRVVDGMVGGTLERQGMATVQTPQAFEAATLRAAHAASGDATDDAALVEAVGGQVRAVPGDPLNVKLTNPGDLLLAEALLEIVERG